MQPDNSKTARHTLDDANSAAGEAGMFWFDRGVHEGFRRALSSGRIMTREMLIQWLEHEVENGPR